MQSCLIVCGVFGVLKLRELSSSSLSLDSDKNSLRTSLKVLFYFIPEFPLVFLFHCESQRILNFYSSRPCCRSRFSHKMCYSVKSKMCVTMCGVQRWLLT